MTNYYAWAMSQNNGTNLYIADMHGSGFLTPNMTIAGRNLNLSLQTWFPSLITSKGLNTLR